MKRLSFKKELVGAEEGMLQLGSADKYTSDAYLKGRVHCHRESVGNHPNSIGDYLQVYYRRFLPHG